MRFPFRSAAVVAAAAALTACASLPRERGYAQADELVRQRLDAAPAWSTHLDPSATNPSLPTAPPPRTAADAVQLAFERSPHVRQAYAQLGLDRAGLEEARRLPNPTFGYSRLSPDGGGGTQITRSVGLGLGDLLLLGTRTRLAGGELEHAQQVAADALLLLASEVEAAWYAWVGAAQIATMRGLVADASGHAADLAQRFFDAGNINRLQLEQELAAAAEARIDAVRATVDALRARATLADLIGGVADDTWIADAALPSPAHTAFDVDALTALALEQRLDLAAARRAVAQREDALGVAQRWRWFGTVELGYEREHEADGGIKRGPSLAIGVPIFDQGQGAIARADAQLLDARASLDAALLGARNAVARDVAQLALAHDIAERYRTVLVPKREAVVARTQEQVNFMLRGVFELISAKQAEYDAYQGYLEAVRDYWMARAALRRTVGGRLPDDDAVPMPTIGLDAILPADTSIPMDHSQHGMTIQDATVDEAADPHAGHRMQAPSSETPHHHHTSEENTDADADTDADAGH